MLDEVLGELLGHTLGERSDEHALASLDGDLYLMLEVIDLMECGAHLNGRIEKARGADELLDDDAFALGELIFGGRRADIEDAWGEVVELLELQWSIVQRSGQAEAVLHEARLTRAVTTIHRMDLWYGHVALVDDEEEVIREVVEEAEGALTRLTTIEVAGVVLDPRAVAQLADHLQVIGRALVEALGFEGTAFVLQLLYTLTEVDVDLPDGGVDLLLRRDEEVRGVDDEARHRPVFSTALWVEGSDALDLVVPEGHTVRHTVEAFDGGEDIDGIALDTEVARGEGQAVVDVVIEDQVTLELLLTVALSLL